MKTKLLLLSFCGIISSAFANNIAVINSSLTDRDLATQTVKINFDVAWENSWRTFNNESNYDGAWIFVKFRKNGTTGGWSHCHVSNLPSTANGSVLVSPTDGMGAFLYKNTTTNFIGNVNYIGNQLTWNYHLDGVADNDAVEIKVFAVEMVYIPTGSYYLGSNGGTEINPFHDGNSTNPYHIVNGGTINVGSANGELYSGLTISNTQINATFPNGYNAFWIMKYECTQQQYSDFLNSIELGQATTLLNDGGGANFTLLWPNLTPSYPERANNSVKIGENCAFADWAGLRPMSEFEFEKTCRGSGNLSIANEYAWGNTFIDNLEVVSNDGLTNESVNLPSTANSNSRYSSPYLGRPVRAGIFARTTDSDRVKSGASFYGVMNMSDNLYEFVINASTTDGQNVTASIHGDGVLSSNGYANEGTWLTTAFGIRGGFWGTGGPFTNTSHLKVSDRGNANNTNPNNSGQNGIRLVRNQ